MFNNKFNSTKKDPLVEAVQIAMQDGDLRRQAEALVNEEFGVFNRRAVVREQLSAYDARLEEAYKCMKEGEKLAKKDYDKDGKVESPKDEVWGSRFRAAKMAGKMEEEQIDEISKALALKAMKKSDERGEEEYDRDMTDDRLSDPKTHWDRAKRLRGHMKRKFGNKTIKTGGTDNLSPKSYEQGGGERRPADKLKKGPRAGMISARHRDKLKDNIKYSLGKHKKPNLPEETQLDELTKPTAKTAHKVLDRSEDDLDKSAKAANRLYSWKMKRYPGKIKKYSGTAELPGAGNVEMHQDKYPGYVTKAGKLTKSATKDTKREIKDRLGKHAKPHLPEGYELDEAAYSAKAARAGKDIGKPGKMFSKIAAKAGKKYGSEERGKKVAGAILKRIRAKHMKEDSSFNSAPVMGKSAISEAGADPSAWAGSTFGRFSPSFFGPKAQLTQRQQSGTSFGAMKARLTTDQPKPSYASMNPDKGNAAKSATVKPAGTATSSAQTFGQAFAAARKAAGGAGGKFTFGGKEFQTNVKGEKYVKAPKAVASDKSSTSTTSATTPGSMNVSAQPAPSAASTAGMTSAAQKVGISQTPSMSGTEFGAGKDMSKSSMPDTQVKGSVTTAPEPAKSATTTPEPAKSATTTGGVSSALADRIKPSQLASNPANLADKNVTKGRESAAPAPTSDAEKKWNERPKYDYSGGKGGVPMNESIVNVGENKYRIV